MADDSRNRLLLPNDWKSLGPVTLSRYMGAPAIFSPKYIMPPCEMAMSPISVNALLLRISSTFDWLAIPVADGVSWIRSSVFRGI